LQSPLSLLLTVGGGTFQMGGPDEPGGTPLPGEVVTVKLSPYFLDEFEVTVAQVAFYLNTTHADEHCKPSSPSTKSCFRLGDGYEGDRSNRIQIEKQREGHYVPFAGTERLPFDGITREGAMLYCAWAGKVLPTEAQWEFAARHDAVKGNDFVFPWGNEFDGKRARCNHDDCPGGTTHDDMVPVGSYDGTGGMGDGRSPWGLHDMAGNAEEIVAGCAARYPSCAGPCLDPAGAPPQQTVASPPQPGTHCDTLAHGGSSGNGPIQLRTFNRETGLVTNGFRCAKV
jgi:formylglycine-generating enzyme